MKTIIRKVLPVLFPLILLLSLIPTTVFAAREGELWVNGVDITKRQDYTVTCGNGTAVYNPDEKTLTLSNATMETANLNRRVIDIPQNAEVTIILIGENHITCGASGIFAGDHSKVTFSGSGNLTINTDSLNGIYSPAEVIVDGAKLKVMTTNDGAISVDDTLNIKNGATVEASGTYYGIMTNNLSVLDSSTLHVFSSAKNSNAIDIPMGEMYVSGATVTATATSEDTHSAIFVSELTVENSANVTATSHGVRGILTDGIMTVTDSTVTATGAEFEGIVATDTFSINNSKIIASGKPNDFLPAIVTYHLQISASDVTANGGIHLYDWYTLEDTDRSFSIAPTGGKLAEFKVDGTNWNGSSAIHFKEGNPSPYDTPITFSEQEINWLDAYRYIHIGEHVHSGGTASCTDQAVCESCGKKYGDTDASNHIHLMKTDAKPATHLTEGNTEFWYCNGCTKYFNNQAGTQEIILSDTVVPKLAEHTADNTGWHSDEDSHWNICECGEIINTDAHTFEWLVDKEASADKAGSKHEVCTICGYAKTSVEIPADGTVRDTNTTPKTTTTNTTSTLTGDDTNIALWMIAMMAAGAVITSIFLYSRKNTVVNNTGK